MDHQTTTVNGSSGPLHALLDRSRSFIATLMDLLSLQGELVAVDAHNAQTHLKQAIAIGVMSSICALAAVPLLAAASVDALRTYANWPLWGACLAVAAVLGLLAILLVMVAWQRATRAIESFTTSRREAKANFQWLREAVAHPRNHHL